MRLKRNLLLFDAYNIAASMLFIIPVILPYYRDEIGLGFKEFLMGEALFATLVVILEVPSGWISDVWKRKNTLILGGFFQILGFTCLFFAKNFTMAMISQALFGISISLFSGTNAALLYDTLLSAGKETRYRKLEGRRMGMRLYAVSICGIIGGFVYPLYHQLPLILGIIGMATGIIFLCMMQEPERHKQQSEHHPIKDMFITMKYALHGHAEIAFIILFSAALFSGTKLIMWSQQPYYMAFNIPEIYYGILMAIGFTLGGMSSHFGHLLDGHMPTYKTLSIFWIITLAVCLIAAVKLSWLGVAILMIGGTCIWGASAPRVTEIINKHASPARRATILSTQNLMASLLFIPISFIIGEISKRMDIQAALLGSAAWISIAGIFLGFFTIYRRKK